MKLARLIREALAIKNAPFVLAESGARLNYLLDELELRGVPRGALESALVLAEGK